MADRVPAPSYTVRIVGAQEERFRDFYHYTMRLPWVGTLGIITGGFLALNVLFALGYWYVGGVTNARPDSFADAFFFSIQTMGTIGYGAMYPNSLGAHWLVVAESVCGLLVTAISTGLVFAKFSLPSGKLAFSNRAVISLMDGVPTLQIRVGNERGNSIAEAQVKVDVLRTVVTQEGVVFYRMAELPLMRNRTPALQRSWTLLHVMDARSPLFGATPESFKKDEVEIIISVMGMDDLTYQTVHGRYRYEAHQVVWGARHVDIISETSDGGMLLDARKFHEIAMTKPSEDFPYPRG